MKTNELLQRSYEALAPGYSFGHEEHTDAGGVRAHAAMPHAHVAPAPYYSCFGSGAQHVAAHKHLMSLAPATGRRARTVPLSASLRPPITTCAEAEAGQICIKGLTTVGWTASKLEEAARVSTSVTGARGHQSAAAQRQRPGCCDPRAPTCARRSCCIALTLPPRRAQRPGCKLQGSSCKEGPACNHDPGAPQCRLPDRGQGACRASAARLGS
jgi:hypothetical protein